MGIPSYLYEEMLARTERARHRSPTPADAQSPSLESELHDQILDYCRAKGWRAVHSRMDKKTTTDLGVPDFIISAPGRVFFIEAKRAGRKPTPEQLAFMAHIRKHGHPGGIVYSFQEFLDITKGNK